MFSSASRLLAKRTTLSAASSQQPLRRFLSTTSARMALTQDQINIVKSTAPILKEHGQTITTYFYRSMLGAHPELKNTFSLRNQQTGAQQKALAGAVLAYATYIDDLPKLHAAVERIAHKHAALFIEPAQYDIVGEHLMKAIGAVLGEGLTPEIADAWGLAYKQLADVFINREAELYKAPGENVPMGWRKFRIAKRVEETPTVLSYYLEPVDGPTPLPKYLPGQYVSLQVPVPQIEGLLQSRQFSLSEAPSADGKYYHVSIKREFTTPNAPLDDIATGKITGLVSNILHDKYFEGDVVELSRPQGDFFVNVADASKADTPMVLLSAGVGVTPLRSILDTVLESAESQMKNRPISWIQASRDKTNAVFGKHIQDVAGAHGNVKTNLFLDSVTEADVKGRDYNFAQELDIKVLDADKDLFINDKSAEYYICGPVDWMLGVRKALETMGVSRDRMNLELFGTGTVPEES